MKTLTTTVAIVALFGLTGLTSCDTGHSGVVLNGAFISMHNIALPLRESPITLLPVEATIQSMTGK